MVVAIIWLIIVFLYLYIFVARCIFKFFAERNFFSEGIYGNFSMLIFPSKAFWNSVFWIISVPKILIQKAVRKIEDEITEKYAIYYFDKRKGEK